MAESGNGTGHRVAHPPYAAYQSLKTLVASCKENGVPDRVDRTMLGNFSGAVGSQLITALKFLDLTTDAGVPTPSMKGLVQAAGGDEWGAALAGVVRSAYQPLFELNLHTATPGQFNERFRAAYPSEGETLRKAITFFLNAARDANIPISPYILKNKKPRSAPTKRRVARNGNGGRPQGASDTTAPRAAAPSPEAPPKSGPERQQNGNIAQQPSEMLLQQLDMSEMDQMQQDAVWTLLRYFKSKNL